MVSKTQLKLITQLKSKKGRVQLNSFIVEGEKIVDELLDQNKFKVEHVFAVTSWIKNNFNQISNKKIQLTEVSVHELSKISELKTPNKVLAIVSCFTAEIDFNDLENELIFVLEDINDPGNLGTIIRIADWFGISKIICSTNTVDIYNNKVIQSTMGSFLRVPVIYTDLTDFSKKYSITYPSNLRLAALMQGDSVYDISKKSKGLIFLGNESHGLSNEIIELTNLKITIPKVGKAESLNVAIAAAVIASHIN